MIVIGVTGQSGAGKGSFCKALSSFDIPCLDTDVTARNVVRKGMPCLKELTDFFGKNILLEDGNLNRKKLGSIVFSDEKLLSKLNCITHKYITAEVQEWLTVCRKKGCLAAAIDAPQLFESGEDTICDVTVAILSEKSYRLSRILARDSITAEYAKKRMDAQKSDEFFISRCDHIIYNNGKENELYQKAHDFLVKIGIIKNN